MELLLIALGVGAYLYYNQAKGFQENYKITFHDASFDYDKTRNSAFTQLYFKIRIEVENPTTFTGSCQSAKLQLIYNNNSIGYASITTPITINPSAITKIEIPVAVPTTALISSISEIINAISSHKSIVFKLNGTVNFAIGTLTVSNEIKVPLVY